MRHKIARKARRMHCGIHSKGNEKQTSSKGRFDCAFQRKIGDATGDSNGPGIMRTASQITTLTMHGLSEHMAYTCVHGARAKRSLCLLNDML